MTTKLNEAEKDYGCRCGKPGGNRIESHDATSYRDCFVRDIIAAYREAVEALEQTADHVAFAANHMQMPDPWFDKFDAVNRQARAVLAKARETLK